MTGTEAGTSAGEIARRHREKIARLERSAVAWEAGAAGERAIGEVLDGLTASGWSVMHDVAWPGRTRANLDHVAVGPGGVFVIDTKNWSGRVEVRDDVLRQNGRSREKEVTAVADAGLAVVRAVPDVPVQAVLCLHGEEPRRGWVREVMLCSTSTVREMLESRPVVLAPEDVARVSGLVETAVSRPPRAAGSTASRSTGSSRRSQPSGLRVLTLILVGVLFLGALSSGLVSSAARTVGDYLAEIVTSDVIEPPAEKKGPAHSKQRKAERQAS